MQIKFHFKCCHSDLNCGVVTHYVCACASIWPTTFWNLYDRLIYDGKLTFWSLS